MNNETGRQSKEQVINAALLKMGAAFRQEIQTATVQVYSEALMDLSTEQLREVFSRAILECKFFPSVAELRGFINRKEVQQDHLAAEREWDTILSHVLRYGARCYPSDKKLEVSAAGEYALRQIGGSAWRQAIASAHDDRMHWLRKSFLDNSLRHSETAGLLAPSRDEARRLLAETTQSRRRLAVVPSAAEREAAAG